MLFASARPSDKNALKTLYARFADRWHGAVLRLGYLAAYDQLVAYDRERRTMAVGPVLDAGCGTGAFALCFVRQHGVLEGLTLLDMSQEMLTRAQENLRIEGCEATAVLGMLGANEIGAGVIETVLCAHVIEHTDTPRENLRWFRSRLVPGGRLLLSVSKPHWCTAIVRWRWGHKAYPPQEIVAMLEQAGFENITEIAFKSAPPSRTSCGYFATCPDE